MAILNNIKNVLSEKGVMSKWLAKQLQKDPATVSKWCNNHSQPDLYTFVRIANLLDVDVHELICHTKKSKNVYKTFSHGYTINRKTDSTTLKS